VIIYPATTDEATSPDIAANAQVASGDKRGLKKGKPSTKDKAIKEKPVSVLETV